MGKTGIEWTGKTWNPVVGCDKVSQGCKFCYAELMHKRLTAMGLSKYAEPFSVAKPWEPSLMDPFKWKGDMVFVNSMSDLFHKDIPFDYIEKVFAVMAMTPQNTYQILTKRSDRMREFMTDPMTLHGISSWVIRFRKGPQREVGVWPLPNVVLGVSVEEDKHMDRVIDLLHVPAAERMISAEPLLGNLDFRKVPMDDGRTMNALTGRWSWPHKYPHTDGGVSGDGRISWIVIGGESGPKKKVRRLDPDWVDSIIGQCRAAGVAVFVKQTGTILAADWGLKNKKGGDMAEWPEWMRVREFPTRK